MLIEMDIIYCHSCVTLVMKSDNMHFIHELRDY